MNSRCYRILGSCMLLVILSLQGCLCSDPPPTETIFMPPMLTSLRSASDRVETGRVVPLEVEIRAPQNTLWHLTWASTCGLVIPSPTQKNAASFYAPDSARSCAITATVRDGEMEQPSSRQIDIRVVERLEKEIIR